MSKRPNGMVSPLPLQRHQRARGPTTDGAASKCPAVLWSRAPAPPPYRSTSSQPALVPGPDRASPGNAHPESPVVLLGGTSVDTRGASARDSTKTRYGLCGIVETSLLLAQFDRSRSIWGPHFLARGALIVVQTFTELVHKHDDTLVPIFARSFKQAAQTAK